MKKIDESIQRKTKKRNSDLTEENFSSRTGTRACIFASALKLPKEYRLIEKNDRKSNRIHENPKDSVFKILSISQVPIKKILIGKAGNCLDDTGEIKPELFKKIRFMTLQYDSALNILTNVYYNGQNPEGYSNFSSVRNKIEEISARTFCYLGHFWYSFEQRKDDNSIIKNSDCYLEFISVKLGINFMVDVWSHVTKNFFGTLYGKDVQGTITFSGKAPNNFLMPLMRNGYECLLQDYSSTKSGKADSPIETIH